MNSIYKIEFIEKLLLLFIVLSSGSLIGEDYGFIKYTLLFLFLFYLVSKRLVIQKYKIQLLAVLSIGVMWTIQALIQSDDLILVLKNFLLILIMFIYSTINAANNKDRFRILLHIIFIASILSAVIFVLMLIGVEFPVFVSSANARYTFLYLQSYFADPTFGVLGYRNSGIFWEPGLNQFFLNLLLIFSLYTDCFKRRKVVIFFLVLLIFTTGSVSGFAVCAIILVIYAFNNTSKMEHKIFTVVLLVILSIFILPKLMETFEAKINTESFVMRLRDLKLGFDVFKMKFLFGYGIANQQYELASLNQFGIWRGNSNGILKLIIACGLVGILAYAYAFYGFIIWLANSYTRKIISPILICFFISLNSEPITTLTIIFFFLGIGLNYNLNKKHAVYYKIKPKLCTKI